MFLTVLSPEKRLVEKMRVDEVVLPGAEGQIQLLPGHASFISVLTAGFFRYRGLDGKSTVGIISEGFVQVSGDQIYVLAQALELTHEINLDRARKAQVHAEETLAAADLGAREFNRYQLKLQRSLIRQRLAAGDVPFI
jgi:F-type H+-transporting ATPase subunit epsilon